MTKKEIAHAIDSELNMCYDLFESILDEEHDQLIEDYKNSLLADGDAIGIDPQYDNELSEDDEPMYLYFSWVNPITKYGLTFMNP